MKISQLYSYSFTGNDNNYQKPCILYPVSQILGAAVGYSIPLKEIDGPDVVSSINSSRKLVMMKTNAPNIPGKWKNALIGTFIGTAIAMAVDYFCNNKKSKTS